MNKTIGLLFILLCFGAGTAWNSASAAGDSASAPGTEAQRLDTHVRFYMDNYRIPGLAWVIVKNNRIHDARAYGVRSLATKEPLTTRSIFHMASVSKPFAATAIMQLVEKGKLGLDDPLVKHLPYFKLDDPRYKEITIRQMLTHTSGIPDVHDYEWDKPQLDDGAAERYVRSVSSEKLIATPGETWRYSNMAFDILADVIAKVSGRSFEDYVKEQILMPLEMKESDFLRERIRPELRTAAHIFALHPEASDTYPYNRSHAPSSCLNANVLEMANWAMANMNRGVFKGKRILAESSYALLFEPQVKINENRAIGLSWILERYRDFKTVFHSGGDLGFRSHIIMLPEKSLAVVVASNYEGAPVGELVFGIVDIMLGLEPGRRPLPVAIPLGEKIESAGIQQATRYYRDLKKSNPADYNFDERQLNNLGYQLLRFKRPADAIEIFKLNVEMFPGSWNAYDSLGEACMATGDKGSAIRNYEKSLQLNPQSSNAMAQLKKLRE